MTAPHKGGTERELGHRALVVEDEPQTAEDVRVLLESRGDRPRVATTVEEALAALAEERFCYVVCDQQLPTRAGEAPVIGGGERVLRAIRKGDDRRLGSFHVLPVVVLTSYSGHEDFVSKMYDLGASAFMSKPLKGNFERLLDKVTVGLERAKRGAHEECAPVARAEDAGGGEALPRVEPGRIAAQLGATSFANIGIRAIDGHTVRITHQRRRVTATYIDLGLVVKKNRAPNRQWEVLLDVCEGHGSFRWKKYGDINNARQRVFQLRKALKEAFGLDEDPFHEFGVVHGWRARFFASSEDGDEQVTARGSSG